MFRRCACGMIVRGAAKRVRVRAHVRAMPKVGESTFEAIGVNETGLVLEEMFGALG